MEVKWSDIGDLESRKIKPKLKFGEIAGAFFGLFFKIQEIIF